MDSICQSGRWNVHHHFFHSGERTGLTHQAIRGHRLGVRSFAFQANDVGSNPTARWYVIYVLRPPMDFGTTYRSSWTTLFQDSRSPLATAIANFHSDVMVIMLFVVGFVLWVLLRVTILGQRATTTYAIMHGATIEVIWTILPRVAVARIALPSWTLLYSTDALPSNGSTNLYDLTLKVIGRQWYWIYEYGLDLDGDESIQFESYMVPAEELSPGDLRLLEVDNRVVVPRNRVIRVLLTAGDVIHSWRVPSLGVKCDAIPGRLNQVFFLANREGVYTGQCSELCGAYHRFMPIVVERVSLDQALTWLSDQLALVLFFFGILV